MLQIGLEDIATIKGECSTRVLAGTCRQIGWHIACSVSRGTLFRVTRCCEDNTCLELEVSCRRSTS